MLDVLEALIARHGVRGGAPTVVPHQLLVREDAARFSVDMTYEPMLCFCARGAKLADIAGDVLRVARGEMFLSLVEMPVVGSFEAPYRSVVLRIDPSTVMTVLAEATPTVTEASPGQRAFAVAPLDDGLLAAVVRWVALLDEPAHIAAIAPWIEQEIIHRTLLGPLGPALRLSVSDGPVAGVRAATAYLVRHATEKVLVADIARAAAMSPATLHRHFKRLTGLTPIQLQRKVRLQRARQLLTSGDHTAASAAAAVGYASPTQFNRDYHRQYGLPPGRDASRLHTFDSRPDPRDDGGTSPDAAPR